MQANTNNLDIAETYQRLQGSLRNFLRKHLPADDIEDILHDIFIKLLSSLKQGKRILKLDQWLYTVAKTTIIDYYRTRKPHIDLPEELIHEAPDTHTLHMLADCLRPLTESLPDIYRSTLKSHEFGSKPLIKIAEEAQLSHSAIKSRASRARKLLKEKLIACCTYDGKEDEIRTNKGSCKPLTECANGCGQPN